MILSSESFTGGVSKVRSVLAIDRQSLKELLLDNSISVKDDANETAARVSERTNSVKNYIEYIKEKIFKASLTLSKDEEKQVNEDDNSILCTLASKQDSNRRSANVLGGACNKKDLKILSNCEELLEQ